MSAESFEIFPASSTIGVRKISGRLSCRALPASTSGLPAAAGDPRLGVPIAGVRKFIAVGMNYADHAAEANRPIPKEPVIFTKAIGCLSGPNDDVMLPRGSVQTDWEVELGVVIGATARYVELPQALEHVAGYCIVNDVSERGVSKRSGGTWDKGKGCDTFGPVGPWLVTHDEIGDPQKLGPMARRELAAAPNRQHTHDDLQRCAPRRVYQLFHDARTGRYRRDRDAAGYRCGNEARPVFLKAGDVMRLGCPQLGVQEQRVKPWKRT